MWGLRAAWLQPPLSTERVHTHALASSSPQELPTWDKRQKVRDLLNPPEHPGTEGLHELCVHLSNIEECGAHSFPNWAASSQTCCWAKTIGSEDLSSVRANSTLHVVHGWGRSPKSRVSRRNWTMTWRTLLVSFNGKLGFGNIYIFWWAITMITWITLAVTHSVGKGLAVQILAPTVYWARQWTPIAPTGGGSTEPCMAAGCLSTNEISVNILFF